MKTLVHVNQHNIKYNSKYKVPKPVLTVKDYKQNRKGCRAEILDSDGNVIGQFIYSPDKPLPCGAKVWFETQNEVKVYNT
tara:strand:- start:240 stop:479 length:240 start_codon:yes stop_codon:yes gene_type:complete